jgi:hypothetical protein
VTRLILIIHPFITGQVAAQIRHGTALTSIAEAQRVLPTLLSDADRGGSSYRRLYVAHSHLFTDVLKSLSPIRSARHDSSTAPSGCVESTRENILKLLGEWAQQRSPQLSIFWLAGLPGTGKTAIAKTFCDRMSQDGKLGASFFVSRHDEMRGEPSNIIRTMPYDLAKTLPRSRKSMLDALRSFPDVMDASLEQLVSDLIASPLSASRALDGIDDAVLLVIDALDECQKIGKFEGGQLIPLLATKLKNQPVKLLITSRMEPSILSMFALLAPVSVRLHEMDKDIMASDVRRYFEKSFDDIRRAHHINDTDWPSARTIDALTSKAGHMFSFACTVVQYVGNDQHDPRTRLRQATSSDGLERLSVFAKNTDLGSQHTIMSAVENVVGQVSEMQRISGLVFHFTGRLVARYAGLFMLFGKC